MGEPSTTMLSTALTALPAGSPAPAACGSELDQNSPLRVSTELLITLLTMDSPPPPVHLQQNLVRKYFLLKILKKMENWIL